MNKQIEKAYEERPRNTVYRITVSVVVLALVLWSGSAVDFSGSGLGGLKIAGNILNGIFHPDRKLLFNLTV
ncbi:hypothetical protein, partial [Pelosinus fermentans]